MSDYDPTTELIIPTSLEEGETGIFARWSHGSIAAELQVTRLPGGVWDDDVVILMKDTDGRWEEGATGGSGGAGPGPWHKPDGWDGDPMIWSGSMGSSVTIDGEEVELTVLEGHAGRAVTRVEVMDAQGALHDVVEVTDATHHVIVGLIGAGPYTLVARDASGAIVRDSRGFEARDVFEADLDEPDFGEDDDAPRGIVLSALLIGPTGEPMVDSGDGPRPPTDREREMFLKAAQMRYGPVRRIGRDT